MFTFQPRNESIREIKAHFNQSNVKQRIIDNILDFLYYYEEPFPMYATPKIIQALLRDSNSSVLHKLPPHEGSTKSSIRISDMVHRY